MESEFLVCYDYRAGGLWGVMIAGSREEILAKYPELTIADDRPPWMDDEEHARLRSEPLWLDDEIPTGILRALMADRDRA
jgi:hypothetical protein